MLAASVAQEFRLEPNRGSLSHRPAFVLLVVSREYSEGQGDIVNGLILGKSRVTIWVIGLLTYLLSPTDPPSKGIESLYNP